MPLWSKWRESKTTQVTEVSSTLGDHPPAVATLQRPPALSGNQASSSGLSEYETMARRAHRIYKARRAQLETNLLSLDGGQPYIDARLSRFAGESKVSWEGGSRKDGTPVTGRRNQAHCIPYPGRIAEKISRHVFAQSVDRGAAGSHEVLKDITRGGCSIHQLMREANNYLTACRWCWIGVDAPADGAGAGGVDLATKEARKVRPYWVLYSPTEVVDWKMDDTGKLLWLLTEGTEYQADDPRKESVETRVRNLWEPGKRTRYVFGRDGKITGSTVIPFPLQKVPFVLIGKPSERPHQFDSIESINRTILDLESCSRQNYFDRVFPQMYLPANALKAAARAWEVSETEAAEMLIGLNYPILLETGDVTPGFVQPNAGDLATIDVKVSQLKEAMFEAVGLLLRGESRAAQSGESKAWDFLDVAAVLKDRALLLEEAETALVALSREWDPSFPDYTPVYPKEYSARDLPAEIQALVNAGQVQMPVEMTRLILKKLLGAVRQIGGDADAAEIQEVEKAIAEWEEMTGGPLDPMVPPGEEDGPPGEGEEAEGEDGAEPAPGGAGQGDKNKPQPPPPGAGRRPPFRPGFRGGPR